MRIDHRMRALLADIYDIEQETGCRGYEVPVRTYSDVRVIYRLQYSGMVEASGRDCISLTSKGRIIGRGFSTAMQDVPALRIEVIVEYN